LEKKVSMFLISKRGEMEEKMEGVKRFGGEEKLCACGGEEGGVVGDCEDGEEEEDEEELDSGDPGALFPKRIHKQR
jgi:hypothetical protein